MNHIYKSIFNKALGVFTAVPEFASAHGKGSERTVVGRVAKGTAGFAASALAISVGLALTSTSAVAGPGIYINDGVDEGCTALPDAPTPKSGIYGISSTGVSYHILTAGATASDAANLAYFGGNVMAPCMSTGNAVQEFSTQTNRTLFYGKNAPASVNDNGAKNLTLGGRLDVNSGIIGVGDRGTNGAGATNSIRMGTGTTLDNANKKANAISIGVDAGASADNAIAMGNTAQASSSNATAISTEANARTAYSIAMGYKAVAGNNSAGVPANGTSAIAIGNQALANYYNAIALGQKAKVNTGADGIAIGSETEVNAYKGTAIGAYAQANGSQALAIGNNKQGKFSVASGERSQVIGVESNAVGEDATAIGYKNTVAAARTYAMGNNINVVSGADDSVVMGSNNTVASIRTYAIGNNINLALNKTADSLAFGTRAHVSDHDQISLGTDAGADAAATASNANSVVIGQSAGRYAQSGAANTAIGLRSGQYVKGSYNIAMGSNAGSGNATEVLEANNTVAIGSSAKASANNSVAIGIGSNAQAEQTVAFGPYATASGKFSTAIGLQARALGDNTIATGNHAAAVGTQQISIGINAGNSTGSNTSPAKAADYGVFIGRHAGSDAAGATGNAYGVGIGFEAGSYNKAGTNNFAIGSQAGQYVEGSRNAAYGQHSGKYLKGNDNVAIGTRAGSGADGDILEAGDTIAIGRDSKASASYATAIGSEAKAKGIDSIAMGLGATVEDAAGFDGIAIGTRAKAKEKGMAVGAYSQADGAESGVFANAVQGKGSTATGRRASIIGVESTVSGNNSVAIGDTNTVTSDRTYAMGNNITTGAGAHDSLAFGTQTYVGNASAIAMGNAAKAVGKEQVSIGKNAGADSANPEGNYYGVYIGSEAGRYQQGDGRNYAIGQNAGQYVKGSSNIALGTNAGKGEAGNVIDASSTIAIGRETKASGYSGIAIGTLAETTHANSIALGDKASATNGHDALAVGTFSKTTAAKAMSIGSYSTASGAQSIVIASNYADPAAPEASNRSTATATRAIVMGPESHATAEDALAIGNKNTVASARTYAIGNNINVAAGADDSLAFGTQAAVGAANTVAIGANANAAQANSVALGAGSTTADVHTITTPTDAYTLSTSYTAAGEPDAANGTVSVGSVGKERQIQNVAAGVISATSTDAINGSQLYATNNYLSNFAGGVKNVLGGDAAVDNAGNVTMSNIGDTGEGTVHGAIKNLKDAIDSKVDTTASVTSEDPADIKVEKEAPVGNTTNYKLSLGDDAKAKLAKAATALQTVEGDSNITATKDATDPTKVKLTLNKNLTADSVTLGDTTTADYTMLNKDGLTVGTGGPVLSSSGIDMRSGQIRNLVGGPVKSGERTAVSAGMLYDVAQTVKDAIGGETQLDSDDPNKSLPAGRLTLSNVGDTGENTIHDAIKSVNDKAKTAVQEVESENPTALSVKKDGTKVTLTPNFITGDLVNADGTVNAPVTTDEGKLVSAKTVADALKANHFVVDTKANGGTVDASVSEENAKVGSGNKVTFEAGKNLVAQQTNTKNGGATVKFSLQDDISLNSVTAGTGDNQVVLGNEGVKVGGKTYINNDGLNANSKVISNVAAGVKPTDAVNKDQLDAVKNVADSAVQSVDVAANEDNLVVDNNDPKNPKLRLRKAVDLDSIKLENNVGEKSFLNSAGLTIEGGPAVTRSGINANNTKVTNVTNGDVNGTSKDAVNGSQLYNVASSVANVLGGNAAVDGNGNVTSSDIGGTGANTVDDAIKAVNATAAKHTTVVEGKNVKVTKGKNAAGGDEYTVATKDDLDVTSVTAGNTTVNNNGLTITGGPSVTRGGIDAGNRVISGVKAGDVSATSQEAVNGSQLHATNTKLANVENTANTAVQEIESANPDVLSVKKNGTKVTLTPNVITGNLVDPATGAVNTPAADDAGKLVTAGTVANALANTHFVVGTEATTGGELDGASEADQKIKSGKKVTLQAGKNLKAKQTNGANGAEVEFSLKDSISLTQVTAGDSTLNTNGLTIAGGPSVTKGGINAGGNTITNVADGVNPNDAVNKGQLDAVKGVADSAVKSVKAADGEENLVVDNADPKNPKLSLKKDLTADSLTLGDKAGDHAVVNKDGLTIANGPSVKKDGIDAGDKTITNVTPGAVTPTSKDAVNGGQLYNVANNVKDLIGPDAKIDPATGKVAVAAPAKGIGETGKGNIGDAIKHVNDAAKAAADTAKKHTTVEQGDNIVVEESLNADGGKHYKVSTAKNLNVDSVKAGDTTVNNDGVTINNGPSMTKDGINANNTKVTNVADGVDAADAVNKGQLDKVDTKVSNVAQNVVNVLGGDATVNGNGDITMSNIGETGKGNINDAIKSVNDLAKKAAAEKTSVKAKEGRSNVTVTEGVNAAGGHEYTVDVERSVTNAGSDYVTVTNNHDADTNTTTYTVDVSAKTKASLAKADSAVQGLTSKDGNLNFTKGANGNVEVSFNDNLNVKNVTTDRVQVANGPSMSKDGINAAGKAISNVANGNVAADSKDAVNGGQLHETAKSVADVIGGGATVKDGKVVAGQNGIGNTGQNTVHGAIAAINQNTANNFNQIRGDLRKMDRDLRGGIAGALATAGLPQAFRPGKSMVAAAASTYRGQSGLAIGVSRISDNGKVILKVTGNTNSRGDFGGTIGAGYQW